jgi:hypothetical protein
VTMLALLSALAACGSVLVGTQAWFDKSSSGRQSLERRAGFDLSCPAGDLSYAPLGVRPPYSSVGVSGCGKRVTYVYLDHSSQGQWVLNTDERPAEQ